MDTCETFFRGIIDLIACSLFYRVLLLLSVVTHPTHSGSWDGAERSQ